MNSEQLLRNSEQMVCSFQVRDKFCELIYLSVVLRKLVPVSVFSDQISLGRRGSNLFST